MKQFQMVQVKAPKKSVLDLSQERKLTCDFGQLVPIMCEEILPTDHFTVNTEILARTLPMIAPVMHRVNIFVHYFFVPMRLVWEDWEDFITGGKNGDLEPTLPVITIQDNGTTPDPGEWGVLTSPGSLWDYFGLQDFSQLALATYFPPVSQLPFRAYQLIFNEFYRDQTLQDEIDIFTDEVNVGNVEVNPILTLRHRNWEKDYFTSALPWTQRGDEVLIPVDLTLQDPKLYSNSLSQYVASSNITTGADGSITYGAGTDLDTEIHSQNADTATSINDLRTAWAIQRFLERMARGGARYIEYLLHIFKSRSSDARLQRPEYLGGGKVPLQISEVLQTSESSTTPQGTMSGHAVAAGQTFGFKRYFEEHGYVIGIMSIIPRTAYEQGTPKMFTKFDRFDYGNPLFANLGEQPLKLKELICSGSEGTDESTFGYQEIFAEYRSRLDSVHGDFKGSLNFWSMHKDFDELAANPALNSNFVKCDPTTRIWPVEFEGLPKVICQVYNQVKAIRPLPQFGTPI